MAQKVEDPVKIFIRDIYDLKQDETESNYYNFCEKLIRKVDVVGIVTEVRQLQDFFLYRVDDCTGEIICKYNHFHEKNLRGSKEIEKLQEVVATANYNKPSPSGFAMEHILEEAFRRHKQIMTPLEQGSCAHAQGFICNFHGTREINAFTLNKVTSISDEIDRVFEVSKLYNELYKV